MTSDGMTIELVQHTVSFGHGAIYWSILIPLVVAGSLLIFRRRDVL